MVFNIKKNLAFFHNFIKNFSLYILAAHTYNLEESWAARLDPILIKSTIILLPVPQHSKEGIIVAQVSETAPTQQPRSILGSLAAANRLSLIFWLVLIALLLPRLIGFLFHSFEVISWPYQVDYDEGLNLSSSWNLAQGRNIYANNVPDHFNAAPYPVIYFLLNAVSIKVWGVQLQSGRLFSFTASLAIAGMIGWCVWMATQRAGVNRVNARGASIVAGLLWFVPPPIYIWSTLYKQDLFAISLALLSITLVYRWQDSKWLWWTAPLMALAFFAKQNELLATGVGCGYIILRDWRRGWRLTLLTLACLAIPFALLNLFTGGGYYNHTIAYQLVPWHFDDFFLRFMRLLIDHPVFIAIGFAYLIKSLVALEHALLINRGRARLNAAHTVLSNWLFVLYLGAGMFSLFTLGAYQGNFNLTLDLFPPLLIVTGLWLSQFIERLEQARSKSDRQAAILIGLLLSSFIAWQVVSVADVKNYFSVSGFPSQTQRELMEDLQKLIAANPGDIVTDDTYLALSAGRAVPYDNLYHMLIESSYSFKWDDSKFLQDLRDRRFGLVLHDDNPRRWSDRAWQVLEENYEMIYQKSVDVWRPRQRPLTSQYTLKNCDLLAPANGTGRATLNGWSITSGNLGLRAGDKLALTTYWLGGTAFPLDYTLSIQLRDAAGRNVAQYATPPVTPEGQPRPFTSWQNGQSYLLDQSLQLPRDLPSGNYGVTVKVSRPDANGMQFLAPTCAGTNPNEISLGNIKIS